MTFRFSLLTSLWLALAAGSCVAQSFYYASSRFDDDRGQWVVYDTLDREVATLDDARMTADAFKTWHVRLHDRPASIRLRWRENPNEWDFSRDGRLISFKPVWPRQFDQWSLGDGTKRYELVLRRTSEGFHWDLSGPGDGTWLEISNAYGYDTRDWNFDFFRNLEDDDLCMAAFFIAMQYSGRVPR